MPNSNSAATSSDDSTNSVGVRTRTRSQKSAVPSGEAVVLSGKGVGMSPVAEVISGSPADQGNEDWEKMRKEWKDLTVDEKKRRVEKRLEDLLVREWMRKKITAQAREEIGEAKDRIFRLVDEVTRENAVLSGKLEEARDRVEEANRKLEALHHPGTPPPRREDPPPTPPSPRPTGTHPPNQGFPALPRVVQNKRAPPQKRPQNPPPPPRQESSAKEPEFELVKAKRARKKKGKAQGPEGAPQKTPTPPNPPKPREKGKGSEVWKDRIEKAKAREPPRAFVVSAGDVGATEAKRKVWSELLKGTSKPRILGTVTLPRGDVLIKPADEETFKALKEMEGKGKGVKENTARRPMVRIYDVEREISKEELPAMIEDQNPELGLDKNAVVPLFMRGLRTGTTVGWVCAVRPDAYQKVIGRRIYIGMSLCRVVQFSSVERCFKCQRFGHRALRCKETEDTCGKCAAKGHRANDCTSAALRCANCDSGSPSNHDDCKALLQALSNEALRTDYGRSPK